MKRFWRREIKGRGPDVTVVWRGIHSGRLSLVRVGEGYSVVRRKGIHRKSDRTATLMMTYSTLFTKRENETLKEESNDIPLTIYPSSSSTSESYFTERKGLICQWWIPFSPIILKINRQKYGVTSSIQSLKFFPSFSYFFLLFFFTQGNSFPIIATSLHFSMTFLYFFPFYIIFPFSPSSSVFANFLVFRFVNYKLFPSFPVFIFSFFPFLSFPLPSYLSSYSSFSRPGDVVQTQAGVSPNQDIHHWNNLPRK